MEVCFVNGEFLPIDQKVIPVDERGHQFGDGVYEMFRVYEGTPFLVDEHLERLKKSADAIQLSLPYSKEEFKQIIAEGIERSKEKNAEVYLQVTRGIAARNHLFPNVNPSTSMTVRKVKHIPIEYYQKGVSAILMEDERWKNCYIKSLNLLPNVLAKQAAYEKGCLEAILVKDGYVKEGSSSNVFVVKDSQLYTHPLNKEILAGITRDTILSIAKEQAISVKEEKFSTEFLKNGDEVFFTSSIMEIMPITIIDGKKVNDGRVGPITKQLLENYRKRIKQYLVH